MMANLLGVPGVLVKTGLGGQDNHFEHSPIYVAEDMLEEVRIKMESFK